METGTATGQYNSATPQPTRPKRLCDTTIPNALTIMVMDDPRMIFLNFPL